MIYWVIIILCRLFLLENVKFVLLIYITIYNKI